MLGDMPTSSVKPRQSHRIGGNLSAGDARFTTRPFAGIASLLVVAALFLSLNITPVVDGPINIALIVVTATLTATVFLAAPARAEEVIDLETRKAMLAEVDRSRSTTEGPSARSAISIS